MIPLRDDIPSSRVPVVNYLIIITCLVVFYFQLTQPEAMRALTFTPHYLIDPRAIHQLGFGFIVGTIFTSMFMHAGALHIGMNMLFLWVFGDNVEDRMGHLRYLLFYLLCGTLAALAHTLLSGFAPVPVLGASGAIAGVLGAYFVLFRGARVRTFIFPFVFLLFDVPAVIFLGLWFVWQVLSALGMIGANGGGVAFWAHIGGFLAGVWLVKRFALMPGRLIRPRVLDIHYD